MSHSASPGLVATWGVQVGGFCSWELPQSPSGAPAPPMPTVRWARALRPGLCSQFRRGTWGQGGGTLLACGPCSFPVSTPARQHTLLCWVDRLACHGWPHSLRGFCICHGSYSEVSRPPPLRCHFLREALPDHPTQTVPFTALRAGAELSARRSTCLLSVH